MMNTGFKTILFILVPGLLLFGCESQPPRQDVIEKIEDMVEESIATNQQQEDIPEDIAKALIPTINLDSSKVPKLDDNQRFDISVNNIPANQFFLSLVDGTEYNMVIHPEVTGFITLNLKNVTIPDVLEAARDVYGFEFISTAYGFQVLPGRLRARIYQINYLNIQRTGISSTQVSSGSLTQISGGSTSNEFFKTETTSQPSTTALGSQILTEQPETSFWTELQDSVQAIVGTGGGRSVVVNPQSGVVVARALPNELREVEAFLQATQLIVQRQVILEAKIIEVILNDGSQTGINWSALLTPGNKSITASNIGGGTVLVGESGVSGLAGNTGDLDPNNFSALSGAAATAFGGVFTLALSFGDFTAFIELLKTQGIVQVLSSPRIATLNNQKAVIKVGTDEFFVTDVTNTTVTGTTTTVTPSVTLTPFFSGIALDVTPQISQNGDVMLHVHPSISEVVDQQKTVTIGTLIQQLPLALSTVRESDSIVRARSGQVIVIGGLMQNINEEEEASVPVLRDLPWIGEAFKHKKKRLVKSELVILLKPTVVASSDDWNSELGRASSSLHRLKTKLNEPPTETFLDKLFQPKSH